MSSCHFKLFPIKKSVLIPVDSMTFLERFMLPSYRQFLYVELPCECSGAASRVNRMLPLWIARFVNSTTMAAAAAAAAGRESTRGCLVIYPPGLQAVSPVCVGSFKPGNGCRGRRLHPGGFLWKPVCLGMMLSCTF